MGNFTDSKRQPKTFSKKFRVAAGSVLENSEKAIEPSSPDSVRVLFRAIVNSRSSKVISIGWYIGLVGAERIVARRPTNASEEERKIYPLLAYQADPILESVKWLGRQRTLLILRDLAFLKLTRFGQILRNNRGLTPRALARRRPQTQLDGVRGRVLMHGK